MVDTEDTNLTANESSDSADATSTKTKVEKRSSVSLPFLLGIVILGVVGYFGVRQVMYMSMLNEMQEKVDKKIIPIDAKTQPKKDPNMGPASTGVPGN